VAGGRVSVRWDASNADVLAGELEHISLRTQHDLQVEVRDATKRINAGWRDKARATARRHGKHYPNTIIPELTDGGFGSVIGPISAMDQGGMGRGFEYGSINQPPHMDMNLTVDTEFPKFMKKVEAVVARDFR